MGTPQCGQRRAVAAGVKGTAGGPDAGAGATGPNPLTAWPQEPQNVAPAAIAAPQWGQRPWTGGWTPAAGDGCGPDGVTADATGASGAGAAFTV